MITGELQAKSAEKMILKEAAKPGARYLEIRGRQPSKVLEKE